MIYETIYTTEIKKYFLLISGFFSSFLPLTAYAEAAAQEEAASESGEGGGVSRQSRAIGRLAKLIQRYQRRRSTITPKHINGGKPTDGNPGGGYLWKHDEEVSLLFALRTLAVAQVNWVERV